LEFFEAFYTKVICGQLSPEDIADMDAVLQTVDLTYLYKEIPLAIQQSQEGIKRVADIIRGMREFSHPGFKCKTPLDLNQVLEKTLTVTKNEWKYIAHIETRFDPVLPLVPCLPGRSARYFST
jgi:two-component system, NtrC family, sensor kinase